MGRHRFHPFQRNAAERITERWISCGEKQLIHHSDLKRNVSTFVGPKVVKSGLNISWLPQDNSWCVLSDFLSCRLVLLSRWVFRFRTINIVSISEKRKSMNSACCFKFRQAADGGFMVAIDFTAHIRHASNSGVSFAHFSLFLLFSSAILNLRSHAAKHHLVARGDSGTAKCLDYRYNYLFIL